MLVILTLSCISADFVGDKVGLIRDTQIRYRERVCSMSVSGDTLVLARPDRGVIVYKLLFPE